MTVLTETKLTAFPKDLLRDRVAVVTGGSRGIGRATVQRLAEAGAHVVVNYLIHTRDANDAVREVSGFGGRSLFAKSLAVELAPKIRVNVVAPGWVDTELNDVVFSGDENERKQAAIDAIPLKRLALAEDVANAIVFLGSDWARHITGEVLNINGGAVLCG